MAEQETNLDAALREICNVTRCGTVDDVVFDLRHKSLDPKDWRMEPIGIAPIRAEGAPFLWFPWFGSFSKADMERNIESEIQIIKERRPRDSAPSIQRRRERDTPDAIIQAGDRVVIDRVVTEGDMTPLHNEHDVQRRLGYIKIVQPSGAAHSLKEPIVFTGASAMWTGGYTNILQKINRRLCAHFGVESLHDLKDLKVDEIAKRGGLADAEAAQGHRIDEILKRNLNADAEAALLHATVLARTDLDALLRRYARRTADQKDRNLVKARIRYMLDEGCLVGYRWGRAEADLHMKPLAEGGLRSQTAAPKGGRESGASRRKKAETTWRPIALKWANDARGVEPSASKEYIIEAMRNREAAKDVRGAEPSASKEDIVEEPRNHETKIVRLPGDRRLMDFLREKEAAGEIPAKQKKTPIPPKKRK